jgi:hypothetical protein
MKVFELLDRISELHVDPDTAVVVCSGGDYSLHRAQPTHVQIQRVCHKMHLRPCNDPLCKTAFIALVIR